MAVSPPARTPKPGAAGAAPNTVQLLLIVGRIDRNYNSMYEHLLDMLLENHPRFISVGDKKWYRLVLATDLSRLHSAGYVIVQKPENGLPVVPAGQMTVDDCIAECSRHWELTDGDPED